MVISEPWYPTNPPYPSYPDPYPLEFPPYDQSPTIINPTTVIWVGVIAVRVSGENLDRWINNKTALR